MASAASLAFKITSTWDGSGVRQAREDIRDLQREVSQIGNKVTARVKVEPSMVGFVSKVREGVKGESVAVRVDPNLTGFQGRLTAAAKGKDYHIKTSVRPDIDGDGLQRRLDALAASTDIRVKVGVDVDDDVLDALGDAAEQAGEALGGLGSQAGTVAISFKNLVANAAGLVGVSAAAQAAVAGLAIAAFSPLIATAAQATTVLAAVPAVLAGVGLVAGTVKIGLTGLKDAFKEIDAPAEDFEKAIEGLAPSAQEFMRTTRDLKGAWDELTSSVQNELFEGMAQEVQQLADTHLPRLKAGFSGIADELNKGAIRFFDKLQDPSVGAAVDTLFANITKAVGPAVDAIGDFAIGLMNIASAGSEALPGIARDLADIARSFKEWTANADNAQKVKDAILNGWDSLKDLARTLWDFATVTLPAAKDAMVEFGQAAGELFRDSGLDSVFDSLANSAQEVAPALMQIASSLAEAAQSTGVSTWQIFLSLLKAAAGIVQALVGPLQGIANLMTAHQGLVNAAVLAWVAFKTIPAILAAVTAAAGVLMARLTALATGAATAAGALRAIATATGATVTAAGLGAVAMGRFGSMIAQIGTHVPLIARMQGAFVTAAAGASTFGRAAGVAAASGVALRAAGSGLLGLFGGPLGVALIGVVGSIWLFASASENARARLAAIEGQASVTGEVVRNLADAFGKAGGTAGAEAFEAVKTAVGDLRRQLDALAATAPTVGDRIAGMFGSWDGKAAAFADAAQDSVESLDRLGITVEEIAPHMIESEGAFNRYIASLRQIGPDGQAAAAAIIDMRKAVQEAASVDLASSKIASGLMEIAGAGDDASKAVSGLKAVLSGLGALNDTAVAASKASEALNEIATSVKTAEGGLQQFNTAGRVMVSEIDTMTNSGQNLMNSLTGVRDEFINMRAAGVPTEEALRRISPAIDAISSASNLSKEQVADLLAQLGLMPKEISTSLAVKGTDAATQDVAKVALALQNVPPNTVKKVTLDGGEESKRRLEELGIKVTEFDAVNGTANVSVADEAARMKLVQLMQLIDKYGLTIASATVLLQDGQFHMSLGQVNQLLSTLNAAQANPTVVAQVLGALGDLQLTAEELDALNRTVSPEVMAIITAAINDLGTVDDKMKDTDASTAEPKVTVDPNPAITAAQSIQDAINAIQGKTVTVTVNYETTGTPPKYRGGIAGKWRGGIAGGIPGRWQGGIAPKGLPGHSLGYRLPTTGPGTGVRDGFLALTSKGKPIANVDAGEWIINGRSSEKFNSALSALNRNNPMAAIASLQRYVGTDRPSSRRQSTPSVSAASGGAGGSSELHVYLHLDGNANEQTFRAAERELVPAVVMAIKQGVGVRAKVAN